MTAQTQHLVRRPPSQIKADKVKAHGAVFTVQVVFALWYIVGHAVLAENDPLTFALLRELLSACVLLGIAQAVEGDFRIKSREDGITILGLVRLRQRAAAATRRAACVTLCRLDAVMRLPAACTRRFVRALLF